MEQQQRNRVALGADHAGYTLKAFLALYLSEKGYEVIDFGTNGPSPSVDYPVYARSVGQAVASGVVDFGILCCGTGIGMAIAANKIPGVRAAVIHDVTTARLAKAHNNANVITIGGRLVAPELAAELVDTYINAVFEERHRPRLDIISEIEGTGRRP